uniref:Uncharacterized protein n=2 Tax=Phaeomonas parva TaxID=124430 RepID=A0A7S1XR89_9STRA|mmetsp:Transcript_26383/g.82205  ORF Transcript_26383/g.82205 Transcript_26383/m.82205 type:complete len:138 (+) Transcript_26383:985-1398(+)
MVVFDETPAAAIAAHEAGMKVVCLIGAYARYELHLADMAITSFSDLNAMSFSRIFAGEDFDPQPALEPLPEPKRRVRVATKTRVAAPPAKADAETETKTAEAASKIEVPDYPPRPSRRTRLDDDEFTMPRRKTFQKV